MSEQQANNWALENAISGDMTLDDIEQLPGFATFPTGAYTVNLVDGICFKQIGDHPAAEARLKLEEIAELDPSNLDADENEKPPTIGDICSIAFMRDNKIGASQLREFLEPISVSLGTRSIADMCDLGDGKGSNRSKGMKLLVIIHRDHDKAKDKKYAKIKKHSVL